MQPRGLSCTSAVLLLALHLSVSTREYAASLRGYHDSPPQRRTLLSPHVVLEKNEVVVLTDAIRSEIAEPALWVVYHSGVTFPVNLTLYIFPASAASVCFQGPGYTIDGVQKRTMATLAKDCELMPDMFGDIANNMSVYARMPLVYALTNRYSTPVTLTDMVIRPVVIEEFPLPRLVLGDRVFYGFCIVLGIVGIGGLWSLYWFIMKEKCCAGCCRGAKVPDDIGIGIKGDTETKSADNLGDVGIAIAHVSSKS